MRIGYVAQNTTLGISASHGLRLSNLSDQMVNEIIRLNLEELTEILNWNNANGIDLYRISSKIIPFASHIDLAFDWRREYSSVISGIGALARELDVRVSMHPGQYTVLNSPEPKIVINAVREIIYHTDFLDLMGMDGSHKIIIHIGGIYGDKLGAMKRFIKNYASLPKNAKNRIVVENDENSYSIHDCMQISRLTGAPVIFDYLHYKLYRNNDENLPIIKLLEDVFHTWDSADGVPKIHFSTQAEGKPRGNHALKVSEKEFMEFLGQAGDLDFDVMFETKDKEKSVLRIKPLLKT